MQKWNAAIFYYNGEPARFQFADWQDFLEWLLVGPEHDWSVVRSIEVTPHR